MWQDVQMYCWAQFVIGQDLNQFHNLSIPRGDQTTSFQYSIKTLRILACCFIVSLPFTFAHLSETSDDTCLANPTLQDISQLFQSKHAVVVTTQLIHSCGQHRKAPILFPHIQKMPKECTLSTRDWAALDVPLFCSDQQCRLFKLFDTHFIVQIASNSRCLKPPWKNQFSKAFISISAHLSMVPTMSLRSQ